MLVTLLMPNILRQACRILPVGLRQLSSSSMATQRQMEEFSMAFVTAPTSDKAKEIAGGLVSNKLAACVNIIPGIMSVYEWEGKIENDSEVLMMIKTRTSRIEELTEFVKSMFNSAYICFLTVYIAENHPYDVCEVITTSIEGGNKPSLDWLAKTVPEKPTV